MQNRCVFVFQEIREKRSELQYFNIWETKLCGLALQCTATSQQEATEAQTSREAGLRAIVVA